MANIAALLKQEITRIVRKELKTEADSLKKTSTRYRSEIAELKRRVASLEQQLKAAERHSRKQATQAVPAAAEPAGNIRFRADGLKKHRERLGLSAPVLASILGVSPQTIYNWESGTSKPSKQMVTNIATLRKMGKREFQERLATMKATA
jgi:DNA-binding transcriptional regulator YiaG